MGIGCGTVGRAVASKTRGLGCTVKLMWGNKVKTLSKVVFALI